MRIYLLFPPGSPSAVPAVLRDEFVAHEVAESTGQALFAVEAFVLRTPVGECAHGHEPGDAPGYVCRYGHAVRMG